MFSPDNLQHQMFLALLLLGMASVVVVSYAADLPTAVIFSFSVIAPMAISFFKIGDSFNLALGAAGTLYFGVIVISLVQNNKRLFENLALGLQVIRSKAELSATSVEIDKAAEKIRRRERELYLIANNMPGVVSRVDRNMRYVYASDQYVTVFGKSIDQVVGSTMQEIIGEKLFNYEKPYIERALTGEQVSFELHLTTAAGEEKVVTVHFIPDFDQNVELDGFIIMAIDITEMKRAEVAQQEVNGRFEKIASRLPGLIYQFCLRPDGSSCFPFASDAINYVFRVSPEEVREDASKVWAIIHPDDYDDLMTSVQISAKDLTLWREEFRVRYEDGTERWLHGNSSPELQGNGDVLWHGFITDITEQKHMEQELVGSQFRWKYALEGAGDAVWDCDDVNNTMYYSKAWQRMLGYSSDEITVSFEEWESRIHPEDKEATLAAAKECNDGKSESYSCEYRICCKDGTYKWVLDRGTVVSRNEAGKSLRMIGTVSDISERKKVQAALLASESHLRAIIDNEPECIKIVDAHGRLKQMNPAGLAMLEVDSLDQIVGHSLSDLIVPEYRKAFAELHARVIAGESMQLEFEVIGFRGGRRWMETHAVPMLEHGENVLLAVTRDVTDRKRAEAALRDSEYRWKFAIEGSGDGVWDVNVQTQEANYSQRWKEMLGFTEEDVVANRQEWVSRIHPDDVANVLGAAQTYLDGLSDSYVVEYRLRCKDESYKWMLSRGMVVSHDEAGNPLRMIGTQTDISDRKNAELLIEQTREELVQSRDNFKDLYEFAPIGYLSVSKHGLITRLNWRASAMLGMDRQGIINQRITQFIGEEEKARWIRMFHTLTDLKSGEELSFDMKFMLHNGISFYANLNCIRTDDHDEQAMLRITLEDVTTIKAAEVELRVAATAFESQDGLMITDAECKILKINQAFSNITGYSNDEPAYV
jgi:PAS domain S-box-containing protein